MFFNEELSCEPLLIEWAHPGTGFKFIKIFGSVPEDDSHDFLLGFKQWEKLSLGASTPNRDTIGKITFK